jgi:hypothetical protein
MDCELEYEPYTYDDIVSTFIVANSIAITAEIHNAHKEIASEKKEIKPLKALSGYTLIKLQEMASDMNISYFNDANKPLKKAELYERIKCHISA